MTGVLEDEVTPSNNVETLADEDMSVPTFDLTKKKKKKKKTNTLTEDDGPAEINDADVGLTAKDLDKQPGEDGQDAQQSTTESEQPLDFALPTFGGKKKKKKKKNVDFGDDLGEGGMVDGEGDTGIAERQSRRDVPTQPWDGTNRDYTYAELVNRAFQFLHGKNPALAAGGSQRKRVRMELPQVAREGTKKTVFLNFGNICKAIHRQQDHLLAYMGAELGTTGNIQEGGRLVIKGRFGSEGIANVLKRYMLEYVICTSCRSPDTVLMRDANTRLYFVSCESCGAKRSVTPIRQGFMAQVEKRKKK